MGFNCLILDSRSVLHPASDSRRCWDAKHTSNHDCWCHSETPKPRDSIMWGSLADRQGRRCQALPSDHRAEFLDQLITIPKATPPDLRDRPRGVVQPAQHEYTWAWIILAHAHKGDKTVICSMTHGVGKQPSSKVQLP